MRLMRGMTLEDAEALEIKPKPIPTVVKAKQGVVTKQ